MARHDQLEERLAQLDSLAADPFTPEAQQQLQRAIKSRTSHVIAKAASIIGEHGITSLEPVLGDRFRALLDAPASADKGCHAKTAVAHALYQLGHAQEAGFLRGIRLVQMEPVWGGRVDVAADLRCSCALALVRMNYVDVVTELADLLADAEWPARVGALRALVYHGHNDAVPLLRYKARVGDDEPQVVQECLLALLTLQPRPQISFVSSFLDDANPAAAEAAALALGQSRRQEAFDVLRRWLDRLIDRDAHDTTLLAIAMLRSDEAIEFLLAQLGDAPPSRASGVTAALAIYRDNRSITDRARSIVQQRQVPALTSAFDETFGDA